MYEVAKNLIGPLPLAFEFIYAIVTLVISVLLVTFLFQLFYIPIKLVNDRR